MKVLSLSTYDIKGGAARAAYRLHRGLQKTLVDSRMLVQHKLSDDFSVIAPQSKLDWGLSKIKPALAKVPLKFYPRRDSRFYSAQWVPDFLYSQIVQIDPDIINLHWVNHEFVQIETLAKFNKPIVWTFHDMWAFTGGCHYSQQCDRYTESCGACPQLGSQKNWDLSSWVWQRKAKAWKNLDLTIVTPSQWLAKCAASSSLLQNYPIEVIPNGIDLAKYKPVAQDLARELIDLPKDKLLVLFGAMSATKDRRKGFQFLQPALQKLKSQWQDRLEIVIFGASEPQNPPDLGFKCHYLGRLNDEIALTLAYSAADVMVVPSLEDNLPNTVMEAIACGIPCVTFNIGGMPDMIEHRLNGYLAQPYEIEDLARGIAWVIEDKERACQLSTRARQKSEQEFELNFQTRRYLNLFEKLLNR